jgi:hypothetical protein
VSPAVPPRPRRRLKRGTASLLVRTRPGPTAYGRAGGDRRSASAIRRRTRVSRARAYGVVLGRDVHRHPRPLVGESGDRRQPGSRRQRTMRVRRTNRRRRRTQQPATAPHRTAQRPTDGSDHEHACTTDVAIGGRRRARQVNGGGGRGEQRTLLLIRQNTATARAGRPHALGRARELTVGAKRAVVRCRGPGPAGAHADVGRLRDVEVEGRERRARGARRWAVI